MTTGFSSIHFSNRAMSASVSDARRFNRSKRRGFFVAERQTVSGFTPAACAYASTLRMMS